MRLVFVLDCEDPARLSHFWSEAIDYRVSSAVDPYVVLVPRGGDGPEFVLQRVSEPKSAKNRMHIDIRSEELDSTVKRLTTLGARTLEPDVIEEAGFRWVVMADPEGNEFCVCVEP